MAKQNRFSTHREANIRFIKYTSTGITLQYISKRRVYSALMNVDPINEDIILLQHITEDDVLDNNNNKRRPNVQLKKAETNQHRIVFPAVDLSTKRIGFGSGSNRVTTVAYEVKYHPTNSTLLTSLLIKSSILSLLPPTDTNIHFIPYVLI